MASLAVVGFVVVAAAAAVVVVAVVVAVAVAEDHIVNIIVVFRKCA